MSSISWLNGRILGAGSEGRESNQFAQPRGVCFDYATREIMVTDCNNHRIQVFQYDTLAFVRQIGKAISGTGPGHVNYAVGMCIDNYPKSGRVYVADTNNHRIAVFNRQTGEFIKNIGSKQGCLPGLFSSPYGVCIDNKLGHLFVADYDNHRIQVLDIEGEFIRIIGSGQGNNPGQLNQPIVVCIDEETGYLYVADYSNNRVQVFNKDTGEYITMIASSNKDELHGPRGICVAAAFLFISDRENHRIQIYDKYKLELIRYIGSGPGTALGQFHRPMELCTNLEDGSLLVVDGYNHRVQILEIPELQPQKIIAKRKLYLEQQADNRSKSISPSSKTAMMTFNDQISGLVHLRDKDSLISPNSPWKLVIKQKNLGNLYDIVIKDSDDMKLILAGDIISHTIMSEKEINHSLVLKERKEDNSKDIIQTQASSMIHLIRETAAVKGSKSSFFVPIVIAIDHILKRQWIPKDIDHQTIECFITLLMKMEGNDLSDEEYSQVSQSVSNFLITAAKFDMVLSRFVLETILNEFRKKYSISYGKIEVHSWNAISNVIAELLKIILSTNKPISKSPLTPNIDAIAIQSEILKLVFGSEFVAYISSIGMIPFFNPETSQKSTPSSPKRNLISTSSPEKISPEKKYPYDSFSRQICLVSDIMKAIIDIHHQESMETTSDDSLSVLKCSLLNTFMTYFQLSHNTRSNISMTASSKRLYRGTRHIWQENEPFQIGDLVDCMDKEKSWFESYVIDILPEGGVEVHFMGWGSKWDDIIFVHEINTRIAPLNTKTKNWREDLFEGGLIEIKCNEDTVNQKWMWGKILALNVEEEWVDVAYTFGSEATINKRAHLYGETICPIGMHTKDKSKVAAAAVIKPARKVEELIKSKAVSTNHSYDLCYLDKEDDFISSCKYPNDMDEYPPCSDIIRYISPESNSSSNSMIVISIVIFERICKVIVDIIDANIYSYGKKSSSLVNYIGSPIDSTVRDVLQILLSSPYKQLVVKFIFRPIITRFGIHSRIISQLHTSKKKEIFTMTNIQEFLNAIIEMITEIELYRDNCVEVMALYFGKLVDGILFNQILSKLEATIIHCSLHDIMDNLFSDCDPDRHNHDPKGSKEDLIINLLMKFIDVNRDTESSRKLRKFFSYIISISSYYNLHSLNQKWIQTIARKFIDVCNIENKDEDLEDYDETIQSPGYFDELLERLIQIFDECKNLSMVEINSSASGAYSAELGFQQGFRGISTNIQVGLSHALARQASRHLDLQGHGDTQGSSRTSTRIRTALTIYQDFYQVLAGDDFMPHFQYYYSQYLANRLIQNRYISLDLEMTAIQSFSMIYPGSHDILTKLISDYWNQTPNQLFQQYVSDRIDNTSDDLTASECSALEMILDSRFHVRMLSVSLWRSDIVNGYTYQNLKLPKIMRDMQSEYLRYHSELHDQSSKRQIIWCLGYGIVHVKCDHPSYPNLVLECNEAQGVIMILLSENKNLSYNEACHQSGLSLEVFHMVIASMSSDYFPLLQVSDDTISMRNQTKILRFSTEFLDGSFLEIVKDDYCVQGTSADIVIKIPSSNISTMNDRYHSHWINTLIDASIVQILKKKSRETSYLDTDLSSSLSSSFSSSCLTIDCLSDEVSKDIRRYHNITSHSVYKLVQGRSEYLVSLNLINKLKASTNRESSERSTCLSDRIEFVYAYLTSEEQNTADMSERNERQIQCNDTRDNITWLSPHHEVFNEGIREPNDQEYDIYEANNFSKLQNAAANECKEANDSPDSPSSETTPAFSNRCIAWPPNGNIPSSNSINQASQSQGNSLNMNDLVVDFVAYKVDSIDANLSNAFLRESVVVNDRLPIESMSSKEMIHRSEQIQHHLSHRFAASTDLLIQSVLEDMLALKYQLYHLSRQETSSHHDSNPSSSIRRMYSDVMMRFVTALKSHQDSDHSDDITRDFYNCLPLTSKTSIMNIYQSLVNIPVTQQTTDIEELWCERHKVKAESIDALDRSSNASEALTQVNVLTKLYNQTRDVDFQYADYENTLMMNEKDAADSEKQPIDDECKDSMMFDMEILSDLTYHPALMDDDSCDGPSVSWTLSLRELMTLLLILYRQKDSSLSTLKAANTPHQPISSHATFSESPTIEASITFGRNTPPISSNTPTHTNRKKKKRFPSHSNNSPSLESHGLRHRYASINSQPMNEVHSSDSYGKKTMSQNISMKYHSHATEKARPQYASLKSTESSRFEHIDTLNRRIFYSDDVMESTERFSSIKIDSEKTNPFEYKSGSFSDSYPNSISSDSFIQSYPMTNHPESHEDTNMFDVLKGFNAFLMESFPISEPNPSSDKKSVNVEVSELLKVCDKRLHSIMNQSLANTIISDNVEEFQWLQHWRQSGTLSSLIISCFQSIIQSRNDTISLNDVILMADSVGPLSKEEGLYSDLDANINISKISAMGHEEDDIIRDLFNSFNNASALEGDYIGSQSRIILAKLLCEIMTVMNSKNHSDAAMRMNIEIIMALLPLYQWDASSVVDSICSYRDYYEKYGITNPETLQEDHRLVYHMTQRYQLSIQYLMRKEDIIHDNHPGNVSCSHCHSNMKGSSMLSPSCSIHWYCQDCFIQIYLNDESSPKKDRLSGESWRCSSCNHICHHEIIAAQVEYCQGKDAMLHFLRRKFESLHQRYHAFLASYQTKYMEITCHLGSHCHDIPSIQPHNKTEGSRKDDDQMMSHSLIYSSLSSHCVSCLATQHYPLSCAAFAQHQVESSRSSKERCHSNISYSSSYGKNKNSHYNESMNHYATCQEAIRYYEDMLSYGIPLYHDDKTSNQGLRSYQSMSFTLSMNIPSNTLSQRTIQRILLYWKIIRKGLLFVAHLDVLNHQESMLNHSKTSILCNSLRIRMKHGMELLKNVWFEGVYRTQMERNLSHHISDIYHVLLNAMEEHQLTMNERMEAAMYGISYRPSNARPLHDPAFEGQGLMARNIPAKSFWSDLSINNISISIRSKLWNSLDDDVSCLRDEQSNKATKQYDMKYLDSCKCQSKNEPNCGAINKEDRSVDLEWDVAQHRVLQSNLDLSSHRLFESLLSQGKLNIPCHSIPSSSNTGIVRHQRGSNDSMTMTSYLMTKQHVRAITQSLVTISSWPYHVRSLTDTTSAMVINQLKCLLIICSTLSKSRNTADSSYAGPDYSTLFDHQLFQAIIALLKSWLSANFDIEVLCYRILIAASTNVPSFCDYLNNSEIICSMTARGTNSCNQSDRDVLRRRLSGLMKED